MIVNKYLACFLVATICLSCNQKQASETKEDKDPLIGKWMSPKNNSSPDFPDISLEIKKEGHFYFVNQFIEKDGRIINAYEHIKNIPPQGSMDKNMAEAMYKALFTFSLSPDGTTLINGIDPTKVINYDQREDIIKSSEFGMYFERAK